MGWRGVEKLGGRGGVEDKVVKSGKGEVSWERWMKRERLVEEFKWMGAGWEEMGKMWRC